MNARWLPMFGAAAAALGGCAVMTIDVDVYKGPLSNHEDVQTEQMAVMAIGAKPLLIKLRDNLEELKRDTPRLPLRGMSWYKEGFIGDGPNGRSHFKDDNAIRVNAILALYADQETRDLSEIFAEGRDALSDSEIAWDIFLDEGRKRSERSWGNLVKGMYRGLRPNGDGKVPPEHPLAQTSADEAESLPESLRDALATLRNAYELGYFKPDVQDRKDTRNILDIHETLRSSISKEMRHSAISTFDSDIVKRTYGLGANARFAALSDRAFVDAHAELLFPESAPEREMFVSDVTSIARGFLASRAALSRLLRVTLVGLEIADDGERRTPKEARAAKAAIDLAARLINTVHLCAVMHAVTLVGPNDERFQGLAPKDVLGDEVKPGDCDTNIPEGLTPENHKKAQERKKEKEQRISDSVKKELGSDTANFVSLLLKADVLFRTHEIFDSLGNIQKLRISVTALDNEFESKIKRQFGLATVPDQGELDPAALIELYSDVDPGGLAGLGGGRLDLGIETLIENYLQMAYNTVDRDLERVTFERRRLSDALVRFAEKVLFIANNDRLLTTGGRRDENVDEYTMVLQAVGNSILIQADELRHREAQGQQLINARDREAEGLVRALDLDPYEVLDRLIVEFETKAKGLDPAEEGNQAAVDLARNAAAEVRGVRFTVLESFRTDYGQIPPSSVMFELGRVLRNKLEELTDEIEKKKLTNVIAAVNEAPTPRDSDLLATTQKSNNAKDVLDRLIAALRHEHILAVRDFGEGSTEAGRLEQAIDAAYDHRAGMAYIRPSGAYLRSSYPSTSLQNDAGLGWRNMLTDHALSNLPFIGGALANRGSGSRLKILGEIDKQFWQNINRVRVAGAGATNYVVAKDDIGNWYVKRYSSDPKVIIKSAQQLALFNLSGPLNTDLIARARGGGGAVEDEERGRSSLGRVFDEFKADFETTTRKDFTALKDLLTSKEIENAITTAWDGSPTIEPIRGPVNDSAKAHLNTTGEDVLQKSLDTLTKYEADLDAAADADKPAKEAERGAVAVGALRSIVRFHNVLQARLRDSLLTEDQETALGTAQGKQTTAKTDLEERQTELAQADEADKKTAQAAVDAAKKKLEEDSAAVTTAEGNLAKAKAGRTALFAEVTRTVEAKLSPLMQRRQAAVSEYEDAIGILGKATKE